MGTPLPGLTSDLKIEVEPPGITASLKSLRIGELFTVTITGLKRFIHGYTVELQGGPNLRFDGESAFLSDGAGRFTGETVIPEGFPRGCNQQRPAPPHYAGARRR